ncbi:hypothetical protein MXB_2831 [Myxobolus squamalis]|nr:hypothetical protein MXB_2831 [Myxobolus squamalis]
MHNISKFEGLIVSPFQKYIYIYVEFQEMNLKTIIKDFVSNFEKLGLLPFFESFQSRDLNPEDKIMRVNRLADTVTDNENISLILPAAGEIFLYYKRCLIQLSKMRNISLNTQIAKNKGSSIMIIKACCCVIATSGYCSETVEQVILFSLFKLEFKICQISGKNASPDLSFIDIKNSFDE